MKNILLIAALLLTALPVTLVNAKEARRGRAINNTSIQLIQQEEDNSLATKDNVVVNDSNGVIIDEIRRGDSVGRLSLSLVAKENTIIKVEYDDDNIVLRNKTEEIRLRKGNEFTLQFAAFGETQGDIKILNVNGEEILTVPYKVLNAKRYSQRIQTGVSQNINRESEDRTTLSIGYRISTLKEEHRDGVHSLSTRVRTDTNFDKVQITIDYTYAF